MKILTHTQLESECMKLVGKAGGMHRKLDVGHGAKHWLDQSVWLPGGVHFIVEFKMPDDRLSPGQAAKLRSFQALGQKVFVVGSLPDFERLLESFAGHHTV